MKKVLRKKNPARRGGFALVLGGGGARGLAHIGVLKVLEREGCVPDLIVGTSMGAIVGGMYAQNPSARHVELMMKDLLRSEEFRDVGLAELARGTKKGGRPTVATMYSRVKRGYVLLRSGWSIGLVEDSILLRSLARLLDDSDIEECDIPFAAVSCDLISGTEVVFRNGPILKAVAASSAIPGIVTPIRVNGRLLVDGGPTSLVPVEVCRSLTDLPIVAVSVARGLRSARSIKNVVDVLLQSRMISELTLAEHSLSGAEVAIRPPVSSYGWADFASLNALIERGAAAASSALPKIKRAAGG
jgi:NTE family protein